MKYWRGYITAAIIAVLTWALMQFCASHGTLVDMIYPYVSRLIQTQLADWVSSVSFCLWQLLAVLLGVMALASIVLMIIFRWNFFQWLGWVLACACTLFFLHTGFYGLNNYAGPLAEDIRLSVIEENGYSATELADATTYFRDKANALAQQVPRDEEGKLDYPSFEQIAELAASGFEHLTYDDYLSVFAGSFKPVKKLGWADMYTSMGIDGITMPLTGEAAVNPQIPLVNIPFTMCHEMAHRMCIASERDANLAAFLACQANDSPIYQYSGYFMAFRYCYQALADYGTATAKAAAAEIYEGINAQVLADLEVYNAHYAANIDADASNLANSVNDTYIKVSGDENGTASYSKVCDLLVSWYIQEIYLPDHLPEQEEVFDPLDKSEVDLSDDSLGGK